MESQALPALLGGRYKVLRLIGRGGMGKVFEVEHIHTGDRLALKVILSSLVLRGDALVRFKQEARVAARIKSDHVVRVTDADVAVEMGGSAYLVMELLDGSDLEQIAGDHPQNPADVVTWLRQVSHGLDKAHALGIVHRDLKPENLFLTRRDDGSPHLKILDFGIAKILAEREAASSGEMIGTPSYMAPEQAVGGSIMPATDRFALGLITFRLLVGQSYWRGETVTQLLHELLYEAMPPPSARGSKLGPRFDEWFATACNRDPARRFESSRAQIDALAEALGLPAGATPSSGAMQAIQATPGGARFELAPTVLAPAPSTRRRAVRFTVAVLGVLVVAGASYLALHERPPPARAAVKADEPTLASARPAESAPPAASPEDAQPNVVATAPAAPVPSGMRPAPPAARPPPASAAPHAPAKPGAEPPRPPPQPAVVSDPLSDQK